MDRRQNSTPEFFFLVHVKKYYDAGVKHSDKVRYKMKTYSLSSKTILLSLLILEKVPSGISINPFGQFSQDEQVLATLPSRQVSHESSISQVKNETKGTIPCLIDSNNSGNSAKLLMLPGVDPRSAINTLMTEQAKMKTKSMGKNILIPTIRSNRIFGLTHLKATVLTIGMIISLLSGSFTYFAVFAISYILEASLCSTRRYLSNIDSSSSIIDYIEKLRQTEPKVKWTVQCYHYQTRTTTDGNGRRTITDRQKVVTHRASTEYHFKNWNDLTQTSLLQDILKFNDLHTVRFVKISILKILFMDKVTMADYFTKQQLFFHLEGNRDWHTELFTSLEVNGFKGKLLGVRDNMLHGRKMNTSAYLYLFWFFTCFGMTVPFRIWFSNHCDEFDLLIAKESGSF